MKRSARRRANARSRHGSAHTARPQPSTGLEPLEPRCLMAADLLGAAELADLGLTMRQVNAYLSAAINVTARDVRAIDGSDNNRRHDDWGATDTELLRMTTVEYADGVDDPAGADRLSARAISNLVAAQDESITNDRLLTDMVWLWGQFIDHDSTLTEGVDPAEPFDIEVPAGDAWFDPTSRGDATIALNRSTYDHATGDSASNPRQQINQITAYLDGSVIYGSDAQRAAALRTFEGGHLAMSDGDLLPFNDAGLANANANPFLADSELFLAGDVRANENALLTAMHTVWVREHNVWADLIAERDPSLSDEQVYQQAKAIVVAELQAITYNQWLPALLGEGALSRYRGYDRTEDASIATEFSTAFYRFGHSMLSAELQRVNDDGTASDAGHLALQHAFFNPDAIIEEGVDSLLRGATRQRAQEIDTAVVDDVRNFLFGPPGAGGFDLASLNIQRGRDHGLADYNQMRHELGLGLVDSFADITADPDLQAAMAAAYGSVDQIDAWVGGLAEDHVDGASVGETVYTVLVDQFERLRDGDRFWYESQFRGRVRDMLRRTTLSDVLMRNTDLSALPDNVFFDPTVLSLDLSTMRGVRKVRVTQRGDEVQIINMRNRRVLASTAIDSLEQITITGSPRRAETIMIDLAMPDVAMTIDAGEGERGRAKDRVMIVGSPALDTIAVTDDAATVNGMTIDLRGVDRMMIMGRGGDDVIDVADDMDEMLVDIIQPRRGKRGRR